MTKIRSFALGGLDEVGKNLFVVEVNQDIFLFDCGLKILKEIDFGINSLTVDFSYLVKKQKQIRGLFITKAEIITAYGIPFLLKKIPALKIFASEITCQLLKQNSHLSLSRFENNLYPIDNHPLRFGNNLIHCFYTATNLPGSCGFSLETLDGYVVYTGTFILENSGIQQMFNTQVDKIVLNKNKPVLLLITNANQLKVNDFIAPHHQVDKWLNRVLFAFQKTLFICCEESEWYKMFQIITRLKEHKFKISFFDSKFGEKFSNIIFQLTKDQYWRQINQKNNDFSTQKNVVFLTGNQKWLFSRILSLINKKDHILSLTKQDHIWIVGESSFVGELVITKTLNELYKTDAQITFTGKKNILPMEAGLEDVKLLINLLQPKYLFPTNARHQDLENARKFANSTYLRHEDIFIRENGEIVLLQDQNYVNHYEAIILENVFVDNFLNTNINETVINERKTLSEEGVLFVGFCYSKNHNRYFLTSEIQNDHFGITKKNDQVQKINNEINQTVNGIFQNKQTLLTNNDALKQYLRKSILLVVKKTTTKKPLVFITANFL